MYLATNLKWLRQRKKRTQEEVAFALDMKRGTYSGYENGIGEPSLVKLAALANYYKITLDSLVTIDLRKVSEKYYQNLMQLEYQLRENVERGKNAFV